ncbi:MAG: mechanosensitive ion channel [Planctomycetes bacterium]|nr:mechanosensitive ion channel [Planctomycetota bacterium]
MPASTFLPHPQEPATTPTQVQIDQWLTESVLDWVGRVLAVLLVLVVAWIVAGWARRAVGRLLERPYLDRTLSRFLGNLVRWLVLVTALVGCLGVFGFNITSVATVLGAAGLAIGLALQGSLTNLAAGVMLLLLRPFKIGDVVVVAGQWGKVDDIDLFQTKIDTGDNRRLILPNASVFNGVIENITHHPVRRCDVNVGTAYGADLGRARAALRAAAEGLPLRKTDRPVDVLLQNLGNHAIEWVVRVWVPTTEFIPAKDQLLEAIKRELDRAGVGIPFPQIDVWMRSAGGA